MTTVKIIGPDGESYTWEEWWKEDIEDDYGLAARLKAQRPGWYRLIWKLYDHNRKTP